MTSLEELAYWSALETVHSAKTLLLSVLGEGFKITAEPVFKTVSGWIGCCVAQKFQSLDDIRQMLDEDNKAGRTLYLYKLDELTEYGPAFPPTGGALLEVRPTTRTFYVLRYGRVPAGK